jgi:hypothetical protein
MILTLGASLEGSPGGLFSGGSLRGIPWKNPPGVFLQGISWGDLWGEFPGGIPWKNPVRGFPVGTPPEIPLELGIKPMGFPAMPVPYRVSKNMWVSPMGSLGESPGGPCGGSTGGSPMGSSCGGHGGGTGAPGPLPWRSCPACSRKLQPASLVVAQSWRHSDRGHTAIVTVYSWTSLVAKVAVPKPSLQSHTYDGTPAREDFQGRFSSGVSGGFPEDTPGDPPNGIPRRIPPSTPQRTSRRIPRRIPQRILPRPHP